MHQRSRIDMHYYFNHPFASHYDPSTRTEDIIRANAKAHDGEVTHNNNHDSDVSTKVHGSGWTSLRKEDAEQCKASGHIPSYAFPDFPFPHAPTLHDGLHLRHVRRNKHRATSKNTSVPLHTLRERHLNVLNSIMHQCLLKGDYDRAGRAWALLLRAELSGISYDIRPQGRWGIGAEILLRKTGVGIYNFQSSGTSSRESAVPYQECQNIDLDRIIDVRSYFERLILQYPARKYESESVSSATFYPTKFGFWVYEVQARRKNALTAHWRRRCLNDGLDQASYSPESPSSHAKFLSNSSACSNDEIGSPFAYHTEEGFDISEYQIASIYRAELRSAKDIAARLDEVISSPPHDKHVNLLHLRGMVDLWIGQLLTFVENAKTNITNANFWEKRSSLGDEVTEDSSFQKPNAYFNKVRENGGSLFGDAIRFVSA